MKKILLSILAVVAVVLVVALLYGAHLVSKLNSPEFREQVRAEVSRQLGAEVRVEEMDISILSGLTLRGVAVANPAPFKGDLFTARSFELRYKLKPLLSGRVEVERVNLNTPVLGLVVDEDGLYNYEALGPQDRSAAAEPAEKMPSAAPPADSPADASAPPAEGGATPASLEIVLSEVSVDDAVITMYDDEGTNLMTVEDADFTSAIHVAGGVTEGRATAKVATISLADMFFVRDISAPLEMSADTVKLDPVEGRMAGGGATGGVTVQLKDGFRYEANLNVEGVDLKTLLQEAQSGAMVTGRLKAATSLEGTGPLPALQARGSVEVVDCQVENSKMLALLSKLVQVPELATPKFEECLVEYTLEGYRLRTPKVSLKSRPMQVDARGTVNLANSTIDYDVNLALAESLLAKIPLQELRAAFKARGDGLSAMDFRVYGTTEAPQTDMLSRVGKAAATEVITDQANKLLKKIF
ncbi:MAG: AsmA family protein [Acidobacteria bacterium]|nr:AsmA family protein [Acidobacteriota bacterium]